MLERLEARLHLPRFSSLLANKNASARTAGVRSGRITGEPEAILKLMGFAPVSGGAASRVSTGNPAPIQRAAHREPTSFAACKELLAIPETEDDAGDDAKIVLKLHRRGGVGKRGAQIVSTYSDGKRPGDGVFDSSTKRIGESSHGST
jgi:hypothetical protein